MPKQCAALAKEGIEAWEARKRLPRSAPKAHPTMPPLGSDATAPYPFDFSTRSGSVILEQPDAKSRIRIRLFCRDDMDLLDRMYTVMQKAYFSPHSWVNLSSILKRTPLTREQLYHQLCDQQNYFVLADLMPSVAAAPVAAPLGGADDLIALQGPPVPDTEPRHAATAGTYAMSPPASTTNALDTSPLNAAMPAIPLLVGFMRVRLDFDAHVSTASLLAVDPTYQSRRVASKIVHATQRYLARTYYIFDGTFKVFVDRPELVAWFLREGFEDTGIVVPYERPEDLHWPAARHLLHGHWDKNGEMHH
ncbi:hypothetical protein THASP1DRAFT_31137 [Thamnocephalis sphaerospora]|uniref:N-acetyltransferase domain-containing protein n=1 Tax=Thamnocephalis sphaerospora TaxID=78915 RepID=A0A4P9XMG2_9FUNG|nr:hypothetical protein THASP1DRAFT_31137 [Thamnocephalis sphaerospora]|eukprot:RKP07046.1 hypothetical protein THASP1DRAFT_31137 [Thamnocephalis sphaerospora]